MEDPSKQQNAIAWLCLVDGLASMQHFPVSRLHDLLGKIAPALPNNHLSGNVRERVALRCLEELFTSTNNNNDINTTHVTQLGFDLSDSCENVLKRILHETAESDLLKDGPGMLRWDVHPFIVHKKSTMPKCALERLKELILDGSNPHGDVLREKCGLPFVNVATTVSVNGSASLNKWCSSAQTVGVEENTDSESLLWSKRDRIPSDNEKRERVNDFEYGRIEVKKMKRDASFVSQAIEVEKNQVHLRGRGCLQDTSETHVAVSVAGNQMAMEQNRVEDDHSGYAASKRYEARIDDAIHKNPTENESNPTSVSDGMYQRKGHQCSCVGEAKNDVVSHCKPRVSDVAPVGEKQHKILAKGLNCNSKHDAHISTLLHASSDQPQQLSNADEGNFRGPENMTGVNVERVDYSDDFHIRAKMRKWDPYYVLRSIEQNLLPLYSEYSSRSDVPGSERVRSDLAENQMEMMEENRVVKDSHDDYNESKRNEQSTYDATHLSQVKNRWNATSMPRDIIQDKACQHTCVDKIKDDGGLQLEPGASGVATLEESQHTVSAKVLSGNTANDLDMKDGPLHKSLATKDKDDSEDCLKAGSSCVAFLNETQQKNSAQQSDCPSENDSHIKVAYPASVNVPQPKSIADKFRELMDFHCEPETSNERDEFHDKKIDAAMKAHAFLTSQCMSTHESLVTSTEKSCSLDCNEGGQLLICKTSNCPVGVHENWLCSSAISFGKGNFYCPFCSYSRALTGYLEAKKQASLLETGLHAFVHAKSENQSMKPVGGVHSKVNNCSKHLSEPEVNPENQCEEHVDEVDDVQLHNIIPDKQPSSSCTDIKSMPGIVRVQAGEKTGEEKVLHEYVSAGLDKFQSRVLGGDHQSSKKTQSLSWFLN